MISVTLNLGVERILMIKGKAERFLRAVPRDVPLPVALVCQKVNKVSREEVFLGVDGLDVKPVQEQHLENGSITPPVSQVLGAAPRYKQLSLVN